MGRSVIDKRARWALPVVALAIAGSLSLFLRQPDGAPEPPHSDHDHRAEVEERSRSLQRQDAGDLRELSRKEDQEQALPVQALAGPVSLPDREAEIAQAEANRAALIAENIASLEEAAARAEEEGNPQRAELMLQRIDLLEARAEQGE